MSKPYSMNNCFTASLVLCSVILSACAPSEQNKTKEYIASQLKDPGAAQFRSEVLKNGVLCGELNSKNSFGAYVGFSRFIASNGKFALIEGLDRVTDKGMELSNDEIIQWLKIDEEIAKLNYERVTSDKGVMSETQIMELTNAKRFVFLWEKYC